MATLMPKIPPQPPPVSSQYTLPRRILTIVALTNFGDDPHGYAAADTTNDHLFYRGYYYYDDDDDDDDYYDDGDCEEWVNSYGSVILQMLILMTIPKSLPRKTPLIQPIVRMKTPIIMTRPMMTSNKKDYNDNNDDVDCFPWQARQAACVITRPLSHRTHRHQCPP